MIDLLWTVARPLRAALSGQAVETRSMYVPTEGGWDIHLRVARLATGSGRRPAVLVVPGLGTPARAIEAWSLPVNLGELARLGVVATAVDLSGRGRSWGTDVYGGPEHHGDVRTALRTLAADPDVDATRIGVISLSLGCAAVAGALASTDRPEVGWWIDWEGPSDRDVITAHGHRMGPAMGHSMDDDAYWFPREAMRMVGNTGVPYVRFQAWRDHAQPGELRHAERMIHAAAAGRLPWFQLNDHPRNDVPANPTWMTPGNRVARTWFHNRVRALARLP